MGWYIELLGGELYCFVQCKSWESSPYLIMFRLTLFSLLTSFYAAVLDAGSWSWPRYGVRQRVAVALVELLVSSSWAHLLSVAENKTTWACEVICCLQRRREHVRLPHVGSSFAVPGSHNMSISCQCGKVCAHSEIVLLYPTYKNRFRETTRNNYF